METDYRVEIQALMTPMHNIMENLFLGNLQAAREASLLQSHGISCIVQCLQDRSMAPQHSFAEYCHVPVADFDSEDIGSLLPKAVRFIDSSLNAGKTVLVHCAAGVSRSSTVVIAYLMAKHSMNLENAIDYVRSRRACISPNPGFMRQLQQLNVEAIRQQIA